MIASTATEVHSRSMRATTPRRVVACLLVVAVALTWWTFLRPSSMGGPLTFVIVSGVSMEPGLHTDDVAVVYGRESYTIGDVVAFRASPVGRTGEGTYVIHRITGGNGDDGFVMRGDNNDWDDPWTPSADDVAGKMLFAVPNLGVVMRWLAQPLHLAALMAAITSGLVVFGGPPKDEGRQDDGGEDDEPDHTFVTGHAVGVS